MPSIAVPEIAHRFMAHVTTHRVDTFGHHPFNLGNLFIIDVIVDEHAAVKRYVAFGQISEHIFFDGIGPAPACIQSSEIVVGYLC